MSGLTVQFARFFSDNGQPLVSQVESTVRFNNGPCFFRAPTTEFSRKRGFPRAADTGTSGPAFCVESPMPGNNWRPRQPIFLSRASAGTVTPDGGFEPVKLVCMADKAGLAPDNIRRRGHLPLRHEPVQFRHARILAATRPWRVIPATKALRTTFVTLRWVAARNFSTVHFNNGACFFRARRSTLRTTTND